MGLIDAHGVHQRDHVADQNIKAVGPRGGLGLAMAAGVIAQDPVAVLQLGDLGVPHGNVGGQGVGKHDPGGAFQTIKFVAEIDAVQFDIHVAQALFRY